ncbi:MAG TPA: ABC transporter permease [Marisediminicola sp.]|jgi:ribose/xylose/arabinose/galactoside ABC-type transport system permease subunit|nr:ABC transporter permease [Marisediminicola sp.]
MLDQVANSTGAAGGADGTVRTARPAWTRSLLSPDQPYALYVTFIVAIVIFSVLSPVFLSPENFVNIGRQTATVTIVAIGMTLIIGTGEIDLSVGATLGLASMVTALFLRDISDNWALGALAGLLTGAIVGCLNGVLTTRAKIPSFLVTLGMLSVAGGLAMTVTGTKAVVVTNPDLFQFFGGQVLGIPSQIIWTLAALAIGIYLLHFSTFGRKIHAVGGNVTAARYSGINTGRVKLIAFVLTGVLAGLAGVVLTAQAQAARPTFGTGIELDVIAAVILGGTSLFGGRGTMYGTLVGSLLIGVLNNGLVLLGVAPTIQTMIKGAIIIVAVAFGTMRKRS